MKILATAVPLFVALYLARVLPPEGAASKLGFVLPQILVLVSAGLVALCFERKDRPRRPWVLFAFSAALMLASRAALWTEMRELSEAVLAASNITYAAAGVDVFLVLRATPLLPPVAPRTRSLLNAVVGTAVIASGIGVYTLVARFTEHGWTGQASDWTRLAALVGLLCDATVFVASLNVAARALPMAGGRAVQPYGLLAAAGLIFLVVDLLGFGASSDFGYEGLGDTLRNISLVAWALYITAGIAQYRLLRQALADEPE